MTNQIVDNNCAVSDLVRACLEPMVTVAEHKQFFSNPTERFLYSGRERCAAVRQINAAAARCDDADQAVRFTAEAQLEALTEVIETIQSKRPELFRETERARDLIENLHLLVNPAT